jgi:CheY-like chemotaxis protein
MAKILVVQDQVMNQDNLSRRLIRRGFILKDFSEVQPALKEAGREPFDLILLDMNLEDMDGWEAARRFKQEEATRNLPIIALSNEELDGAEEMARDAGCADFEPRPIDLERLLGKIQPLIQSDGTG